ncbi:MAG: hypothetical protein AAGE76_13840 [Pseudomonadota bacterium]
MNGLVLILRAISISPMVFLRYLPVLVIYILLAVGIFYSTSNLIVWGMLFFLMSTIGTTFLFLTGVRAALMVVGATTSPTVEGLTRVTVRSLFLHMLPQFILVILLSAIWGIVHRSVVLPMALPGAADVFGAYTAMASAFFSAESQETFGVALAATDPMQLQLAAALFVFGALLIVGFSIGIFGVPMAALAANAVQYSPGNDPIYGIGKYLLPQMVLYLMTTAAPTVLFAMTAPVAVLVGGVDAGLTISAVLLVVFVAYAPCISYAGMALGYDAVRRQIQAELRAQRAPIVDMEQERETLKELRQMRKKEASGTKMYDPVAEARARRRR